MSNRDSKTYSLFVAKGATGVSNAIFSKDFRNAVVTLNTANSANMTVKFQGAIVGSDGAAAPDFSAAQSSTNQWDYVQAIDLQSGAQVDGDTGFVVTGTDDHKIYEFNTNHLDYISLRITARSAGDITADITLSNNE